MATLSDPKDRLCAAVDARREHLEQMAMRIWENPEVAFEETTAVEILTEALAGAGFTVTTGIGGLETAFSARYGDDDPVVGVMGEFDALPGLSQERAAEQRPREAGDPGHGCGHNLFGVGSLGGAFAIQEAIADGLVEGSVVYFGTPAEEAGSGKAYMARAGAFDPVDVMLSWHPGWYNAPGRQRTLAVDTFEVTADGTTAHAAAAPEGGRSALDAIQLLNTAVEFMREHVPEKARVHYVIDDGGAAPNVVPGNASAEYYLRAPNRETVEDLSAWFRRAADGAGLMADVDVAVTKHSGMYGIEPNQTLADAIAENMTALGGFELDAESRAMASDLRDSIDTQRLEELPAEHRERAAAEPVFTDPVDVHTPDAVASYSTDSGDVSQLVPLGRFRAATFPVGTPLHSWQAVAASGTVGVAGMCYASKVIATTLYDLLTDPALLAAAREEFTDRTSDRHYTSPLPSDADPEALYD